MEKTELFREKGHPPSQVNFSERLYEKKIDPIDRAGFPMTTVLAHALIFSPYELTRLGEPKCLYGEKLARLGELPF